MNRREISFAIGKTVVLVLIVLSILGACEGTLLTEIRRASQPSMPEIAVLVDGTLVDDDSLLDLGIHSTSAPARSITVTVKNTGKAGLELPAGAIELTSGDGAFDLTVGVVTATSIAAGSSENFTVSFEPNGETTSSALISITSNDPDYPVLTLTLSCTGADVAGLYDTVPDHLATGVLKGTNLAIVYSKLIEHTTIDTASGTPNITIEPSVAFDCTPSDASGRTTLTLDPDSDLTPGQQYTVKTNQNLLGTKIQDTDGLEAQPVTLTFTILPLPTAPGTNPSPIPNTTTNPLSNPVTLDWPDFTGATGYALYYKAATAGGWTRYPSSGTTAGTDHSITCAEDTLYNCYFEGTNDSGALAYPGPVSPWTFTTGYYQPAAPALVSPANNAVFGDPANITFSWNSSTNALSYTFYYKYDGQSTYTSVARGTSLSYTRSLVMGKRYTWYVRAVRGTNGANSTVRALYTLTPPSAPGYVKLELSGTKGGGTRVSTGWTDTSSNESGFRIEGRMGPSVLGMSPWGMGVTVGANVTSYYQDVNPPGITDGYYVQTRVRSFNAAGDSAWVESDIVQWNP
jgi:hypothetical protein